MSAARRLLRLGLTLSFVLSVALPARAAPALPVTPPVTLPASAKAAPPGAAPEVSILKTLAPYDEYYGVYVSGQKVGWMRSKLYLLPQPVLSTELHAKVSGMGQTTAIDLREERAYAAQSNLSSGILERLSFVQTSVTGSVTVTGRRRDDGKMQLDVKAGGSTHTQVLEVSERLGDALASASLARAAKIGSTAQAVHLDPTLQKIVRVEHRVASVQRRNFAGVDTKAVKVASNYPDLGVNEVAWLDGTGKVLESQIGGFFVARLEPPEVAKRLDYTQDLLISAVVRAPRVLMAPQNLTRLTLKFTGFGETLPPQSARQKVQRDADGAVRLTLNKDPLPRRTPLASPPATPANGSASPAAAASPDGSAPPAAAGSSDGLAPPAAAAPGGPASPGPAGSSGGSASPPPAASPGGPASAAVSGSPGGPPSPAPSASPKGRGAPALAPSRTAAAPTAAGKAAAVPPEVAEALLPTAFIQSTAPELVAAARNAVGNSKDVFSASTKLVGFVYRHIRSEYVPAYSNALEAFHSARGDCTEHSILYVGLARAVGIPARVAVGIAYWPPGDGFGWHAWAEIYVADRWIAVDPTWNQPIADATHVKLADGGPAEQARIVMLLGKLKILEMKAN